MIHKGTLVETWNNLPNLGLLNRQTNRLAYLCARGVSELYFRQQHQWCNGYRKIIAWSVRLQHSCTLHKPLGGMKCNTILTKPYLISGTFLLIILIRKNYYACT